MPLPTVSIIIPCYNMNDLIKETIDSVEKVYDPANHELIIVDDGSTEPETIQFLKNITKHQVIRQENRGLANARNTGISKSKGKYLLFLDADNLLTEGYLNEGVAILNDFPKTDIIYGESETFGEKSGRLPTIPFNLQTLMSYNYIDACCLIRKTLFDELGGFDEEMPTKGFEDWELWLRASFNGKTFHYLEGITVQKYRVRGHSMIRNVDKKKRDILFDYLEKKYPLFLSYNNISDYYFKKFKDKTMGWTAKLFIKKYFPKLFAKLVQEGKFSKYL